MTPGTVLGSYEIRAPLGAGGMGEVYRARDMKLGRDVAVKVLPAAFAKDRDALLRFEQEARAVAALSHPNILAIFDFGSENGTAYAVLELLEGATLRERLDGPVPPGRARAWAAQIARGLAAAHERGIVHRDVKPENVFVTRDGVVKLLDFGLAKQQPVRGTADTRSPTRELSTEPGTVLGTLGYMSPEQVKGETADHRTDIFSVGVVLYEMLTGERAFQRGTGAETMTAILREDPPAVSAGLPLDLDRTVRHCLEKDPADRFQSARDLAFALDAPSQPTGSRAASTADGRSVRAARALPWALFAGTAAALVLALRGRAPAPLPLVRSTIVTVPPDDVRPWIRSVLSPDGDAIAYLAPGGGKNAIVHVRRLSGEERLLPGTEGTMEDVRWSPDGRSIAFAVDGTLKRIDLSSGTVQTLHQSRSRAFPADWGEAGILLSEESPHGILLVPASGGAPRELRRLDAKSGETNLQGARFLDATHYLFGTARTEGKGDAARRRAAIYVASTDRPEARLLVDDATAPLFAPPRHVLFVRGGELLGQEIAPAGFTPVGAPVPLLTEKVYGLNQELWFDVSVSRNGLLTYRVPPVVPVKLALYDRSGREVGVAGEPGYVRTPRFAPGGSRIAYFRFDPATLDGDVWIHDLTRGTSSRVTFVPGAYWFPSFFADGRSLLYTSDLTSEFDLYRKVVGADSPDEPFIRTGGILDPGDVSADGSLVAFHEARATGGRAQVALYDVKTRAVRYVGSPSYESTAPPFSPDGRYIVYESLESGAPEIYARPISGEGEKMKVSLAGGDSPLWSGTEIFFVGPDGRLWAAPASTASGLSVGKPAPLFPLPKLANAYWGIGFRTCDVAPDGKRFVAVAPAGEPGAVSVTLVQNWPALLRPR
jgi:serine/threonine protein kinase/Tol biopolymer transport system component